VNENILLVEDEEDVRITLGDRLMREGFAIDPPAPSENAGCSYTRTHTG